MRDNYKNRIGEKSTIEITEDSIAVKSTTVEIKCPINDLLEVFEIRDYYFIKTGSGTWFLLNKAEDIAETQKIVDTLVNGKKIKHTVELDWQWK